MTPVHLVPRVVVRNEETLGLLWVIARDVADDAAREDLSTVLTLELLAPQASWYRRNLANKAASSRMLRVVAVEPLSGGRKRQAFYSTCSQATALQVLALYAKRWSVEVAFHDAKTHLGFEEPQGWSRGAVERTAPVAMLLYSLIVSWFAEEGHRHYRPVLRPWYAKKSHATFTDMIDTLRRLSVREQSIAWGLSGPGSQKILDYLEKAVSMAA